MNALLTASFVAGLVPAVLFVVLYAARSRWRATPAGRALMGAMVVTAVTYISSTATLVFPDFFRDDPGVWLRVGTRVIVAVALWNLLAVLVRAQRQEQEPRPRHREGAR